MKIRRLIRFLLVLFALLLFSSAPPVFAQSKIDARVALAVANGGRAPVLVVLSEQADLSGAARLTSKREKGRYVLNVLRATADRTQAPLRAELDRSGLAYASYYIVNLIAIENADQTTINALAARTDVARIESNAKVRMDLPQPETTLGAASLASVGTPWGISKINAPALWSLGIKGKGIVYANADTGVKWNHAALKKHYRGWNGLSVNHNYNWWDAVHQDRSGDGTNPCGFNSKVPCDDYGHGTHTAGTGVGGDGKGNQIGVAPGAKWIACRNMEEGYGTPAQYIECFEFFLAPWNLKGKNPNPDKNADVISNSWTCPPSEGCAAGTLQQAVEAEEAAGIFVVASAGNSGSNCSTIVDPPAIYQSSFTVGATNSGDALASFSSRGPITADGSGRVKPDISAPGANVLSAWYKGGYVAMDGTSMASPHVAGAVALLWQARPNLRGDIGGTRQVLKASANPNVAAAGVCGDTDATVIPNNLFGYGRLDVYQAVQIAPK